MKKQYLLDAPRPAALICRAVLPAARQIAAMLVTTDGFFVPVQSVKSAWDTMAMALSLSSQGELIRRSIADIMPSRLPASDWGEIKIFLDHDRINAVTDLYAPFRPDCLRCALAALEKIIDEIEALCPGAFAALITAAPESAS